MPRTILIVDDNDQNRILLRSVLIHYGYMVLEAADGAEAVRMAQEQTPDLILMDILMPVMNGIDAGKVLRADPRTKGITMLALSAFNLLADDDNFFNTGFDGYIAKPIDIRKLPETVRNYLDEKEVVINNGNRI